MPRLFFAVELPPEARAEAARVSGEMRERLALAARWTPADDLHLTLCFLGDFEEARRPALERTLAEELRGLNAPELRVTGTGGFPNLRQPRVLWAGVDEIDESLGRLDALHNRVRQAALSLGWRPRHGELRRPFQPHITVARVRRGAAARVNPAFAGLRFRERWLPLEVALFESNPSAPDKRYATLCTVPLVVRHG